MGNDVPLVHYEVNPTEADARYLSLVAGKVDARKVNGLSIGDLKVMLGYVWWLVPRSFRLVAT